MIDPNIGQSFTIKPKVLPTKQQKYYRFIIGQSSEYTWGIQRCSKGGLILIHVGLREVLTTTTNGRIVIDRAMPSNGWVVFVAHGVEGGRNPAGPLLWLQPLYYYLLLPPSSFLLSSPSSFLFPTLPFAAHKRHQHCVHLVGRFLLHPMADAVEITHPQIGGIAFGAIG